MVVIVNFTQQQWYSYPYVYVYEVKVLRCVLDQNKFQFCTEFFDEIVENVGVGDNLLKKNMQQNTELRMAYDVSRANKWI